MTHIFLQDLQAVYDSLFKYFPDHILVYHSDYYWCVNRENIYLDSQSDIQPVVGSLIDDFNEVKNQLKKTDRITNTDIDRFAYLIQAIAWKVQNQPQDEVTISVKKEFLDMFWAELIKRFKASNGSGELCIEKDFYWAVESKDIENFDGRPTIIECSLQKDWADLKVLIDKNQMQKPKTYYFELFGRVLRVIEQHLVI